MITLEYHIKKIRLNGGKTAPLVADALSMMAKNLGAAIARVEASKDHKIFWQAVNECRKAGEELEATRHATGFITREELDGQLKRSDIETALWCAATAVVTAVVTAVLHG